SSPSRAPDTTSPPLHQPNTLPLNANPPPPLVEPAPPRVQRAPSRYPLLHIRYPIVPPPSRPPSSSPEAENSPSPSPPSTHPPSPPARMIDINQPPPSSPTDSSPILGNEVHSDSRLHELVEGLTTSISSEDEHFIPPGSPSTVISPQKVFLLTWYNHSCTRMPAVLTDPIPHTGEDESVGLEDIVLNDHEAAVEPVLDTDIEDTAEPDLEAEVRNLTSIPTKKRKGLGRIFATRSKAVLGQPLKKKPRRAPPSVQPKHSVLTPRKSPRTAVDRPEDTAGPSRVRATRSSSNTRSIPRPPMRFDGFSSEVARLRFDKIKNKQILPDKGFDRRSVDEFSFIRESINVGDVVEKAILYCAKRRQGKLFFPGLIHKLLMKAGVPEFTDDLVIKECEEKWTIDIKAVSRLRERSERGRDGPDLNRTMDEIVELNGSMMDLLIEQKAELIEKIEAMHADFNKRLKASEKRMKKRFEKLKDGLETEVAGKLTRMQQKLSKYKTEAKRLRTRMASMAARSTQPTPSE
ncbi:MICAL-like protein 1, partial [Cynara cardunculus var. scolymus]|uniref:MICAL-like protein 1 n=1 Tax=Cynara cardunculus var. scolymus TaxID=59895 RepID=UPI000D623353